MKILLVNNFHYHRGGSETVYFNIAHLLQKNNHEVKCFSFIDEDMEKELSNCYFVQREKNTISSAISYVNNIKAANNLDQLLRSWHPDVAHLNLFWGGLSSSILPVFKKHSIPVVYTAHDYRAVCPAYTFKNGQGILCEKCKNGKYFECILGKCAKSNLFQSVLMSFEMYFRQYFRNPVEYIDGIIYVSDFAKNIHERLDARLQSVNNIVLYNFTSPIISTYSCRRGQYFLYFGRLSNEKGINTLIDAFSELPSIRLKIVGDGPLREDIERRVAEINNIEYCGFCSGTELVDVIRDCSWVVVPSEWYENNPMTVIEAFSYGKPIIGSEIGGIPELIGQTISGFLFQAGNVSSLKSAIISANKMTDSEYQKFSSNSFIRYEQSLNEEHFLSKLLLFYREISVKW